MKYLSKSIFTRVTQDHFKSLEAIIDLAHLLDYFFFFSSVKSVKNEQKLMIIFVDIKCLFIYSLGA